jgi:hypothetical protein
MLAAAVFCDLKCSVGWIAYASAQGRSGSNAQVKAKLNEWLALALELTNGRDQLPVIAEVRTQLFVVELADDKTCDVLEAMLNQPRIDAFSKLRFAV